MFSSARAANQVRERALSLLSWGWQVSPTGWNILISRRAWPIWKFLRAIVFTNWSTNAPGYIRFPSTTNGGCAFDLKMAMRTT